MKDLRSFLGESYEKYADKDGRLYMSYLDSNRKKAWFLQQVVDNVDNLEPSIRKEMTSLVNKTYENCYTGMVEALKSSTTADKFTNIANDISVRPEVLKQALNNNISKLTLPRVLDKHRAEIIYQLQNELNIGLMNGDRYETMAKRISERLDVSYSKAMNITRTETHRNIESGFMDSAENIQDKLGGSDLIYAATWRTMKDERVRPQQRRHTKKGWKTTYNKNGANHIKMEGVTVKAGELFDLGGGVKAKAPSQSGVAAHDCRCRCYLEYNLMTAEEFAKATSQTPEKVREKYDLKDNEKIPVLEKVELQLSDYPEMFTKGAEGKNTQKLIDYINGLDGADPTTLQLYSSIGKMENISSEGIPFKVGHGKNSAVSYTYSSATHQLKEVKISYPKLTGDNIAGQVNTTLHEQMHLIDMYNRENVTKYNNWFSSSRTELVEAFRGTSSDIGEDMAKLFKEHNSEYSLLRDKIRDEYKGKVEAAREKYLPNGMSIWEDIDAYKKFEKERKKLYKELEFETDYQSRNIMGGGIGNLQDIYDALSKGQLRGSGVVKYGHGAKYYAVPSQRIEETIANYATLSVTRPDLIDMLRKDKPELCKALDETIKSILERVAK